MYTSTFIFESKPYDEDFLRLDAEIAQRARAIPGFLGEEAWDNPETGLHAEVYYWDNQDALRQLIAMPVHQEAKRLHERWIGRYRVVIAEVLTTYGDDTLGLEHRPELPAQDHPTAPKAQEGESQPTATAPAAGGETTGRTA